MQHALQMTLRLLENAKAGQLYGCRGPGNLGVPAFQAAGKRFSISVVRPAALLERRK